MSVMSAGLVLAALAIAPTVQAKKKQKVEYVERFSAHVVSLGTLATGATGTAQIALSGWTDDEDRQALLRVLVEEGSESLVDALREEEPVGFIRLASTRGWDIHYAREHKIEGGRIIIFATDRPIGFGEAFRNTRSLDYNLMVGQLRIPDEGDGEGLLAVGVEAVVNKETGSIELTNYSSEPLRLSHVRSRAK